MIDSNIIRTLSLVFLIYLVFIMSKEKIGILNCSLNRLIKKRYIFLILVFVTIFVYIQSQQDNDEFFETLKKSLVVFCIFMVSTKTDGIYLLIFLGLSCLLFIEDKYMINNEEFDLISNQHLEYIKSIIFVIAIIVLLMGLISYFLEKRKQYKNKFSLVTFIVGVDKCN
jgi:hypothetical protein